MIKILGFVIVAILLIAFVYFAYRHTFKKIKVPSVALITGGVKTGKSLLTVKLSIKDYRKKHRIWHLKKWLLGSNDEEPLYYTNVSISFGNLKKKEPHRLDKNIRYLTLKSLLREERYNYKSVIYIQEASLMADNMDFNNKNRNIDLSLYAKLIAHETKGGSLYLDTQSVLDVHYAFKRVSSTYLFIQKSINLKLFHILWVREMINTENGVNSFNSDVDDTTRMVLIPFWYHHKYNRYEFSYLTDELNTNNQPFVKNNGLVSFNPSYCTRSDKRGLKK